MAEGNVVNKLIEENLPEVMQSLYDYVDMGVELDDLMGEAALTLTQVVNDYVNENGSENIDKTALKDKIDKEVNARLTEYITETNSARAADQDLADRMNDLSEASIALFEELGRTPTAAELAEKLDIEEDEVERMLKMSDDAAAANKE